MSEIYFTEEHEYVVIEGNIGTVGISDYAQGQLGDVVYVETPEVGANFDQKEETGVIESVKVASEIYAPLSGEIIEINDSLTEKPSLINEDPMGDGWLYKIKIRDADELEGLKPEGDYNAFLEGLA